MQKIFEDINFGSGDDILEIIKDSPSSATIDKISEPASLDPTVRFVNDLSSTKDNLIFYLV